MAMHANWNPWHGCIKCSEGCQNCYVYYLDGCGAKAELTYIRQKQALSIRCQNIEMDNIRYRVGK